MSFTVKRRAGDVHSIKFTCDQMPLYGIEKMMGVDDALPYCKYEVNFRTFDDDGNFCTSGTLHDDNDCENQTAALRWAESDQGAVRIEVMRNGEWTQDIG